MCVCVYFTSVLFLLVIAAPARGESVRANLRQYGLEALYLDMLIADAAQCVWREGELFDAIVTDRESLRLVEDSSLPNSTGQIRLRETVFTIAAPYGVREGARKIGSKRATPNSITPER